MREFLEPLEPLLPEMWLFSSDNLLALGSGTCFVRTMKMVNREIIEIIDVMFNYFLQMLASEIQFLFALNKYFFDVHWKLKTYVRKVVRNFDAPEFLDAKDFVNITLCDKILNLNLMI